MNELFTALVLASFLLPGQPAEEVFSSKEKTVIYTHSLDMLKEYERYINEIGVYAINDMEAAQSSSEACLELFVNRQVLIYNDLDPAHQLSPFYEAETYISNLLLWYHDGIEISMDFENALVGNIQSYDNEVYSLDILINKQINGNYLNRTPNRNLEELLFRVAFSKKGAGNYRIVGIRNAASDLQIDYSQALGEVNSEELRENERIQVDEGARSLLNDYINYLTLISDPGEIEEDKAYYRESFTGLFAPNSRVFNDLEPEPANYLLSTEEYMELLTGSYPEGIHNLSMNLDSAATGQVVRQEDGSYRVTTGATKFFAGLYEGDLFRDMFPLNFSMTFERSGQAFVNFNILGIDLDTEDFYSAGAVDGEAEELPSQAISTISRKGIALSFYGGYGYSMITNKTLPKPAIDYENNNWKLNAAYGYHAGVNLNWYLNDHFAVVTGAGISNFQGSYQLEGHFQDSELSQDVNGDDYHLNIQAEYDSALSHTYIEIPLLLNYTSSKPGKVGFFAEAGATFGLLISSSYTSTGDFQTYGYYPDHVPVLQYLYLEELGFYDQEDIFRTGDPGIAGFNLSGYLNMGVVVPIGYFSNLMIGPELHWGFTDINKDIETLNIYGRAVPHETVTLNKIGLKLSYVLKL